MAVKLLGTGDFTLTTCVVIYNPIYNQSRSLSPKSHTTSSGHFERLPIPRTGQQERQARTYGRVLDRSAGQDCDGSGRGHRWMRWTTPLWLASTGACTASEEISPFGSFLSSFVSKTSTTSDPCRGFAGYRRTQSSVQRDWKCATRCNFGNLYSCLPS